MRADQFRAWRKGLRLKQKDAAELLGLKKRMIQYYERGHRDGRSVAIPKSIRLACYAISQGIGDFDGDRSEALDLPPERHSSPGGRAADDEATSEKETVTDDA